jgi:hypothetical protein
MVNYRKAPDDLDCESAGRTVFLGNIALSAYQEPDTTITAPASAILALDAISAPGTSGWRFHFVTVELQIEAPAGATLVHHSQRNNYHREVPADPAAAIRPDPDDVYWTESDEPTTVLRIREDETALLFGEGNGRTYYVGVAGVNGETNGFRFTASAAGSLVREVTCHLVVDELELDQRIAGYLG